jgi:hypothetical protein
VFDPNSKPIEILTPNPVSLSPTPPQVVPPVPSNTMRVMPSSQDIYTQQLPGVSQTPFGLDCPAAPFQQAHQMTEPRPTMSHPSIYPSTSGRPEQREESYPYPTLGSSTQQGGSNTLKPKTSSASRDDFVDRINSLRVPSHPVQQSSPSPADGNQGDREDTNGRSKMEAK